MRMLIILFVVLFSSVTYAQTTGKHAIDQVRVQADAFWKNKVDATTDWGKWLLTTKPYWDQFVNVEVNMASSLMKVQETLATSLPTSLDDSAKLMNPVWVEQYKEMQNITPPEELKAYHAIVLQENALMAQINSAQQTQQLTTEVDDLTAKSIKELHDLLNRHGIPQSVIDTFLKG